MQFETSAALRGMDIEQAFQMFGATDNRYRITWHCGRAEAAARQRRAGVGEVTQDGYVRETNGDPIAALAGEDPDATVEILT